MPTLISRGTAAARAFGLTGSSSGQLYTQTFTSDGTFTPMAGVTNVVTLVGRGGSSTSDAPASFPDFYAVNEVSPGGGSGGTPLPLSYSTIAQDISDIVNTCNAGGFQTIYHNWSGSSFDSWYILPDDTYLYYPAAKYEFSAYMVAGSWSIQTTGSVPNPPSGSINSRASALYGTYHAAGQYIAGGSAGTNSSALGYTFAGASQVGTYPNATGQAATPVTYNNVAVTPGTGYPIVVGAGGSVAISFIIP